MRRRAPRQAQFAARPFHRLTGRHWSRRHASGIFGTNDDTHLKAWN
jgi:hypothetical protein